MASGANGTGYFSPIAAVKDFFDSLSELSKLRDDSAQRRLLGVCDTVSESGERVVKCLNHQMHQQNRANEFSHEVLCAFQLGLRKLIQLRAEVDDLKKVLKELQLAEQGLDSRTIGAIPSSAAAPFTPMSSLQRVHKDVVSTNIAEPAIPRAASYEDFLRHKDLTLSTSGSKKAESSAGGSSIRKAKSDTDVAANTLRKKIESLSIDNNRLKTSEKTLVKKNIKLTRNCKALEKERDMAEDRLKIEQTQRDSIEKLRQRNKELEQKLKELCDTQVIREREAVKAAKEEEATQGNTSEPPGEGDVN